MNVDKLNFRLWNGKEMFYTTFDRLCNTSKPNDFRIETQKANDIHIMQSTGITDINGKEIYQSDILLIKSMFERKKVVVLFDSPVFDVRFKTGKHELIGSVLQRTEVKVIGNIYENPKLTL